MKRFDCIVVGLGAMGSSTCLHLARRGVRVLGLEQFDIPHSLGSSGGHTRMTRLAYSEHSDYVPLLRRAYELWHQLEADSGQKLLYLTGGLYMGPKDGPVVSGALQSARQHGLKHDILTDADMAEDYPQFRIPPDWTTVHEPMAGFLLSERIIAATAELALRQGAELRAREPMLEWRPDGAGVIVTTPAGQYSASQLVICGGAWSSKIIQSLRVPLIVTRQALAWVWPRNPDAFALGQIPVFAIDSGGGTLHYGFPMMSEIPGFKFAYHAPGEPTDPDQLNRLPMPGDHDTYRPALARYLPEADGPVLSLRVCMYTNSPDHHFILDRLPDHPSVSIACGFSGHGFKFASVIGQAMADLATEGRSSLPIDFLSLRRFTSASK